MAGKLIIVSGLPGSGKTTHAKALERSLSALRLCADEWMDALNINLWDEAARAKVEALQWVIGKRLLAVGQTLLIEWGNWGKPERDALREAARALVAKVELHYVSASIDVLFERIQQRKMEQPPITREQVEEWAKGFHVPTAEEAALYDRFWSNTLKEFNVKKGRSVLDHFTDELRAALAKSVERLVDVVDREHDA